MPEGARADASSRRPRVPGKSIPPTVDDVLFLVPEPLKMRFNALREALLEYDSLQESVKHDKGRGVWCPTYSLGGQDIVSVIASWTSIEVTIELTEAQADAVAEATRSSPVAVRNWWSGAKGSTGELLANAAVQGGKRRAQVVLESAEDGRAVAFILHPLLEESTSSGRRSG